MGNLNVTGNVVAFTLCIIEVMAWKQYYRELDCFLFFTTYIINNYCFNGLKFEILMKFILLDS